MVFAHQDRQAEWLRFVCIEQGVRVPEDVGILGVDNGESVCLRSKPELSSIVTPWHEIGRQMGSSLLDPAHPLPIPRLRPDIARHTALCITDVEAIVRGD